MVHTAIDTAESGHQAARDVIVRRTGFGVLRRCSGLGEYIAFLEPDEDGGSDLVVTDMELPRMDGFELAPRVRVRGRIVNCRWSW